MPGIVADVCEHVNARRREKTAAARVFLERRRTPAAPMVSEKYSVLDPYGFVFYTWGVRRELPMRELKNYTALKDRMLARPAVQRVVEQEKIKT